jgi:hypothetical protein
VLFSRSRLTPPASVVGVSSNVRHTLDLLQILRTKIESVDPGAHSLGLAAVLTHVTVAARHLVRGQESKDDSAFTDAVYRCNQAFEGSIKEAYRVLAEKDPENVRPFDIENYLESNKILRSRVLALFSNYRKDWRNPSTHDYTLTFTESEAFVAITSVASFSTVLCDEILLRLSFRRAQSDPTLVAFSAAIAAGRKNEPPVWQVAHALASLGSRLTSEHQGVPSSESQFIGLLAGMLSSGENGYKVLTEEKLTADSRGRPDMVIQTVTEDLALEVKRARPSKAAIESAIQQVEAYLWNLGLKNGLVFFTPTKPTPYDLFAHERTSLGGKIIVAYPRGDA